MTQTHTPKPWSVSRFNDGYYALSGTYAEECDERDELSETEDEANRLIIEAAPDMLETLNEVLQYLQDTDQEGAVVADMVRAAIAKAEGGAA